MVEIKTKGIVVNEMAIGENDKRLVIITKEKGKITAFARGARKTNSRFLAGSQLFSYGEYILVKGKSSSYNIKQIQLIESFHAIRTDIESLAYGLYVLEFVSYITEENVPNIHIMRLMLKTLQVLISNIINYDLVMRIFELKAMSYIGYTPNVVNCVICGNQYDEYWFSITQGGIICKICSNQQKSVMKISNNTIYTMRYILSISIDKLYSFNVNEGIKYELTMIMKKFIEYHLNHKFKSLDFLLEL
ncbi:DNA repair protein RecO [Vallitalea longa]|uniref:DNA repair protein RecO n=1 Tax=Vallitalea longa TaxID=2936439 RepID=A0A9W5YDG2_9FIRM|nr:DNA repair protein RecO [Vallitalea longa]GKX31034.1 DNA repair protein RecO [Vallitalea longa]